VAKPCMRPGCPNIVERGYCDVHRPAKEQQACLVGGKRIKYDRFRGSAASRGYDRNWQAVRREFLQENPLCEDCAEHSRFAPATEAHHVMKVAEYPELRLRKDNLRALCRECHSVRTAHGE
jgi:5-methylcytosine-specific restriction protein A